MLKTSTGIEVYPTGTMHKSRRLRITDINPNLICVLCSGYLIDATTIIECLHSFCRSCIVKYLESNKYCPICDVQVHKTKPLLNIRSDQTLQDIVYKLVPGLFQNEMCRRRDFYSQHPDQKPSSAEESGEVTQFSHIYTADESISLSLEYYNSNDSKDGDNNPTDTKSQVHPSRRYLRCPAAVSVQHLQKLIRAKYGLSNEHRVDILYMNDRLRDDFTLMDIAYIYLWRRKVPLHLTYRIFEVAKRIKLEESEDKIQIKKDQDENSNKTWKEVQLQISENGIMSVMNIEESKPPEKLEPAKVEVKQENKEIKEESVVKEEVIKQEVKLEKDKDPVKTEEVDLKVGEKRKLEKDCDDIQIEPSAKVPKPSISTPKPPQVPLKNIQQLSRNHPLKIHSQTIKNHAQIKTLTPQKLVAAPKVAPPAQKVAVPVSQACQKILSAQNQPVVPQKVATSTNQPVAPQKVATSQAQLVATQKVVTSQSQPVVTQKVATSQNQAVVAQKVVTSQNQVIAPSKMVTSTPQKSVPRVATPVSQACTQSKSKTVPQNTQKILNNNNNCNNVKTTVPASLVTNVQNTPKKVTETAKTTVENKSSVSNTTQNVMKYTQASQSTENTITTNTKYAETSIQHAIQRLPTSNAPQNTVNSIQYSKVSIVPRKSPVKVNPIGYKTLRDPPKAWNPQISRQSLVKSSTFTTTTASTSDSKLDPKMPVSKPAKFFKMRNNMPRYLGNPASGVKPMYQVREGDKSPPDIRKGLEAKKKDDKCEDVPNVYSPKIKVDKIEIKKQGSIIKIDPKTLRPISDKMEAPSCSDMPEMKINQSTVPILNPLRTQKSQTSPKIDRRSPKTSYMDVGSPKSPLDNRSSPKINAKSVNKPMNSPTNKKDKLNLNFTPPNPFIPNLASPNLAPNQFLYPSFPSYDPRVMNNLPYHNIPLGLSMFYSQPRLNYPGLSSQSLPLSPNLMSSLNLEVNKNLRVTKGYEIPSIAQLSPNVEKKNQTTVKRVESPRESYNGESVDKEQKNNKMNNKINSVKSSIEKPEKVEPKPEEAPKVVNKPEEPKSEPEKDSKVEKTDAGSEVKTDKVSTESNRTEANKDDVKKA